MNINRHNIVPCSNRVCLCVEYLDFGKNKDREKYKHCLITADNNYKYENMSYDKPPLYHFSK